MKPPAFLYAAPPEVDGALAVLGQYGSEAKVLAGGQSLMPLLNMRLVAPAVIVDLNRIKSLDHVTRDDGVVRIGAMTRQRDAELSPVVKEQVPLLAEALAWVGHPQIRNRGTIGGSLAHADPSAELPAVALILGATFVLTSPAGTRRLSADEFFRGYLTTALDSSELLTEVAFPVMAPRTGYAFAEVSRRHGDFALVGVAALANIDHDGRCTGVRLAFTGVSGRPQRVLEAEAALDGRRADERVLSEVEAIVAAQLEPDSDIHASADYRRRVAGVLARRALQQALRRASKAAQ